MRQHQLWLLLALLLCTGCAQRRGSDAAPDLAATAAAYQQLGAALRDCGLLPLPRDAAALAAIRPKVRLANSQWRGSGSSNGTPVWQLGNALTLLCSTEGQAERLLLLLPGGKMLEPPELGAALERLSRLSKQEQRPTQGFTAPGQQLEPQPFYFDLSYPDASWRFQPQFSGERCVRIDVFAASP